MYQEREEEQSVVQNVFSFFGNMFSSETRQRSPERRQVMRSPSPIFHQPVQILRYEPVVRPRTVRMTVRSLESPLDFMRSFEMVPASPSDPNNDLEDFLRALSAAAGAPDSGNGIDPEDLKLIISILISVGCLTASGPLLIVFETAGFVWTGYNLAVKIDKMATRISNGEDVLEPNRENLVAWLDITADVAGLSSTVVSKGLTRILREGRPRDCANFLAIVLKGGSLCSKTTSMVFKQASSEYFEKHKKMSPQRKQLEFIATVIHFIKVLNFAGYL